MNMTSENIKFDIQKLIEAKRKIENGSVNYSNLMPKQENKRYFAHYNSTNNTIN